jgi:hypothetical protein
MYRTRPHPQHTAPTQQPHTSPRHTYTDTCLPTKLGCTKWDGMHGLCQHATVCAQPCIAPESLRRSRLLRARSASNSAACTAHWMSSGLTQGSSMRTWTTSSGSSSSSSRWQEAAGGSRRQRAAAAVAAAAAGGGGGGSRSEMVLLRARQVHSYLQTSQAFQASMSTGK